MREEMRIQFPNTGCIKHERDPQVRVFVEEILDDGGKVVGHRQRFYVERACITSTYGEDPTITLEEPRDREMISLTPVGD